MEQFIALIYNENMKVSFTIMRAENREDALTMINKTLKNDQNCLIFNEEQLINMYQKMKGFFEE